jgi:polyisoprenoid-binding protein YceI
VQRIRRHWKGLTAAAVLLVAVLAVGVPWAYVNLVEGDQPPPLSLDAVASETAAPPAGSGTAGPVAIDGTWTVARGSQAGYRVEETLAGQSVTAVGRTGEVTGSVTVGGSRVTAAEFTVDMASVTSDQSRRDSQFAGRIMETDRFPTGTFRLTAPIELGSVPAVGATVTANATGDLTLHGVTRQVTFPLSVRRTATTVGVTGTIPIRYGDHGIANPSVGGFVSVGEGGTVEFLLVLGKQ